MKGRWVARRIGTFVLQLAVVGGGVLTGLGGTTVAVAAAAVPPPPTPIAVSAAPVHQDVSAPLANLQPPSYNFESALGNDRGAKKLPRSIRGNVAATPTGTVPSVSAPTPGIGFDGIGQGFGAYVVCCAPPDPNGSVGPNHYVETVNLDLAVFNKSGALLYGPVPINTLWSTFGGGCEIDNDGDPSVLYDRQADRWIISQFAVTTTLYLNCVAVSTTGDPLGTYNRYSYSYADFPDYPKFGVWPDAYYVTFNMFAGGTTFSGGATCSYDRAKMLTGAPSPLQQCFNVGTFWGGLLPSTLDGATPPPAGSPNYVLALDTACTLASWKFHVDWTTPASTTMTGPFILPVAPYTSSCSTLPRGDCIPQGGTTQTLESLSDRLMYRLAYRNFGDHEAMVVNHTVEVGSGSTLRSGVRWYELRASATNLSVFQQGTYAPDSSWRFMGSAAFDKSGNIGLGYSVSGTNVSPQIHYTGRLAGDPAGMMTQGENVIIDGGGSQLSGLARWGDYSSMAVDPIDDCTFWYTNEYLKASGIFNWSTRIGTFKLPGCASPAPSPDFSLSAAPASQTVTPGAATSYSVTVTPSGGFAGSVALSVSGLPTGSNGTFNPASTTSTSNLSVTTATTTPAGSYPLTITGTSGTLTRTTSATLVVSAAATPDFSLSASPPSVTVIQGVSASYTVTITPSGGFTGAVRLSVSGLPSGATGTFSPNPASASATLSVTTLTATPPGSYPLTITGVNGSLTRTAATVTLVVQASCVNGQGDC